MFDSLTLQGFLFFALALTLSLVLVRIMIPLAPKLGLVDTPGERRIHTKVIPRAGGIAIWMALLITLFVLTRVSDLTGKLDNKWLLGFGWASLVLVITGLIDDRRGMNAWLKLSMHAAAPTILFFLKGETDGSFFGLQVPPPVELLIWIVWSVAIINAFNLIDGMDGLCAGLGFISVASLMVLNIALRASSDAIVLACALGALLGFLRYNFHPARIFLGDTGSMLIGFFIASVALVSTGERFTMASLLLPLVVAGVPLIDVLLAVWRRSFRKWLSNLGVGSASGVFDPDQHHLHHRLLSQGLTQRKVATLIYALALIASAVALVPTLFDDRTIGLTIAALLVAGLMGFRYLAPIELRISGEVLNLMIQKPRRGRISRFWLSIYDIFAILTGIAFAYFLVTHGKIATLSWGDYARTTIIPTAAVTLAIHLLFLNAARAYSRRWSRASLRDYFSLILWFVVGAVVAMTMNIMINDYWWDTILTQTVSAGITCFLILIPRSITPLIRESVVDSLHRNLARSSGQRPRVLLYGAGNTGEFFINYLKVAAEKHFEEMRIIGFLDDHPELEGRFLDGFRVHGSLDRLPDLQKRWDLHGIIITSQSLSFENQERLKKVAAELDLQLYDWNPQLSLDRGLTNRKTR